MPKYNVVITADSTVSTVVDVEADSPQEAEQLALEEASMNPGEFDWVKDDTFFDPYLADEPGKNAEEVS